ncbi:MAG: Gfo/Idh/MocA family oxidoreductase [Bacteroidales bacterium]|nr:Gfo/Idh/MocA family oxidoreductase [Bacteroidales bacterium]
MRHLRFGVIGLSPGNGHPFSWSAIFNGYDRKAMATCPFPLIPAYLAERTFPADCVEGVTVTHVWTQNRSVSEHVSAAALIPHIVDDATQMIGEVDAVLLARDDAEHHLAMAAPFLAAGLPIYIDKPLALTRADAQAMYAMQQRDGQIFTCSALAYADEFRLSALDREALGRIHYAEAMTPKDWDRYAVHVVEPLLRITADRGLPTPIGSHRGEVSVLDLRWRDGLLARITALGNTPAPIAIRLYGERGYKAMTFADSFSAFREALQRFADIVAGRAPPQSPEEVLPVIDVVEAGRQGG